MFAEPPLVHVVLPPVDLAGAWFDQLPSRSPPAQEFHMFSGRGNTLWHHNSEKSEVH